MNNIKDSDYTYITYSKTQNDIVESGIDSIKGVFKENDKHEIRSLLFCLDKYLDPYYRYNLAYEKEIFDLLQIQLLIQNDEEIVDDIIQLLRDYCNIYLVILSEHIHSIDGVKQQKILELLTTL